MTDATNKNGRGFGEQVGAAGDEKAHAALSRLLAAARAGKLTGDAYLRLVLNQGGVRTVKVAIEEE